MNFLKSLIFGKPNPNNFFEKFEARANGFCIEKGILKKLEDYLLILFEADSNKEYTYDLIVGTGSVHSWTFRIDSKWKVICKPDAFKKTIDFEIQVTPELVLLLEFPSHGSLEVAGEFRLVLSRLIYQTRNKKSFSECPNQKQLDDIIEYSEQDLSKIELTETSLTLIESLKSDPNCEFAVAGQLFQVLSFVKSLNPESILTVFSTNKFSFELRVVYDTGDKSIPIKVDENLNYYFDYKSNLFLWNNILSASETCFAFKMSNDDLRTLESLFLQFFVESKNKMPFEQYLKSNKEQWLQFYSKQKSNTEDEHSQVKAYQTEDDFLKFDFEQPIVDFGLSIVNTKTQNQSLIQSKTTERIMAVKDGLLDIYTFNDQQENYEFMSQVSFTGKSNIIPSKIQLQEHLNHFIFNDTANLNQLVISDFEKQSIVRTFTPFDQKTVKDFGILGGKTGQDKGNELLIVVGGDSICKVDPRDPSQYVDIKTYSSKMNFDRLVTVSGDALAISSEDGSVRLYKDMSISAKNLIPSYLKDRIINLDSSKDGLFLLANCGRYLMLYLTHEQQTSGYLTTFQKTKKPIPRILKVHPGVLSSLKIKELSFVFAKFDEHRIAHEKFIIAWNDSVYAVWSITRIMRNEYSTSVVRHLPNKVVCADFKYDADDVLTVFPNKIGYQKTNVLKKGTYIS